MITGGAGHCTADEKVDVCECSRSSTALLRLPFLWSADARASYAAMCVDCATASDADQIPAGLGGPARSLSVLCHKE